MESELGIKMEKEAVITEKEMVVMEAWPEIDETGSEC